MQQRRELDFRGRKIQVVLAKSTSVPQFPERSGFIRVRQCQVKLAMESDGSNRSKGKKKAAVGVLACPMKAVVTVRLRKCMLCFP